MGSFVMLGDTEEDRGMVQRVLSYRITSFDYLPPEVLDFMICQGLNETKSGSCVVPEKVKLIQLREELIEGEKSELRVPKRNNSK